MGEVDKVFNYIESTQFAVKIRIESGLSRVLKAIGKDRIAKHLLELSLSPEGQALILRRALRVAEQAVDFRYENPNDISLTTYLWLLQTTNPKLAAIAAEAVASLLNCWWASQLARVILQKSSNRSPYRIVFADTDVVNTADNKTATNLLVSGIASSYAKNIGAKNLKITAGSSESADYLHTCNSAHIDTDQMQSVERIDDNKKHSRIADKNTNGAFNFTKAQS